MFDQPAIDLSQFSPTRSEAQSAPVDVSQLCGHFAEVEWAVPVEFDLFACSASLVKQS